MVGIRIHINNRDELEERSKEQSQEHHASAHVIQPVLMSVSLSVSLTYLDAPLVNTAVDFYYYANDTRSQNS